MDNKMRASEFIIEAKSKVDLLDKPTGTVNSVARKHGVDVDTICRQLAKGIKVELEHTSDREVAKEIAMDHLGELPDYYDRLEQAEK
jgi:hypothetical protein